MTQKGAEEARNQLPHLIAEAAQGRSTIITKHGRAVAALVPIDAFEAAVRQAPLTPAAGTGRGLWGKSSDLAKGALVLVDSAPIIYILEDHPKLASRFKPLFEAHAQRLVSFAVTTITIAEVLTGPMRVGDDALARRYRSILESWRPVGLDVDIAESAARLRASLRLSLADAVQAASALAINAAALATHDRDFSRVHSLRILS
jgi:prevent-host-death family protein